MAFQEDPRLMESKAIPMKEVVDRLGIMGLRATGQELIGPCPCCGGRDRFGVNIQSNAFLCRKCEITGGDQIALVMSVLNVDFKAALQWLCGDAPAQIDPEEMKRRKEKAAAAERKQQREQARYRKWAMDAALGIWKQGRWGGLGVVPAYLRARGILPDALVEGIPDALRFIVDHPYVKKIDGKNETVHRGPCMIAGVLCPRGELTAVHQTWVDTKPPHGKAKIIWKGEDMPAKLVRGSKKAGAIRLFTPENADTLVMGEGIETTLSALVANPLPDAAYWAGVDLGNMSGRMQKVKGKRHSGLPDMTDTDAFVPPPWVKKLIFIMDGDSAPEMTHAKLLSGLRRAMAVRAGLETEIVQAGPGVDLNDVLIGESA
ncbi:hypothetical protein [Thalassobius sp. I31.1]|uniref:DUF7146 domain-containing protein n=1 Tax=Thalassobius sp. I31.1 TaxID=2109912 RepID=UPI000D19C85A|nr:hypothetical protein [Thalassobius sp. I31.1]